MDAMKPDLLDWNDERRAQERARSMQRLVKRRETLLVVVKAFEDCCFAVGSQAPELCEEIAHRGVIYKSELQAIEAVLKSKPFNAPGERPGATTKKESNEN